MVSPTQSSTVPRGIKLAFLAWMVFWVPVYWVNYGPVNFLWLCGTANFLLLLGILSDNALIISSQAVGVLLVQILWTVDVASTALTGFHPIGGTEYMFDASVSLWLRSLSLFHVAIPPLLVWLVYRLGYDRRGIFLQTAVVWLLLPATYWLSDPQLNINWLDAPFGIEQTLIPAQWFLLVMMAAYPLVLFTPTHFVLRRLFEPPEANA